MRVGAVQVVRHTTNATKSLLAREMKAQSAEVKVNDGTMAFPEGE